MHAHEELLRREVGAIVARVAETHLSMCESELRNVTVDVALAMSNLNASRLSLRTHHCGGT
jgi:hypothetical protein